MGTINTHIEEGDGFKVLRYGLGSIVLIIGTCSAIMYWFARFFAGFGLALYVYRTTRIGQMKSA